MARTKHDDEEDSEMTLNRYPNPSGVKLHRFHRGLKPLGLKWQHVFHLLALVASPVRNSVHPKPESSNSAGKTDSYASCAGPAIGFRLKCGSERVERNIR
jgi:hypothetical protein